MTNFDLKLRIRRGKSFRNFYKKKWFDLKSFRHGQLDTFLTVDRILNAAGGEIMQAFESIRWIGSESLKQLQNLNLQIP